MGSWRFFLAFLVVISHLYSGMMHGPAAYAVWGFFVLSGYLMTYIINEKYGIGADGIGRYAFNRFLRIVPQYWLCCLVGLAAFLVAQRFSVDLAPLNPEAYLPGKPVGYVYNFLLNPICEPQGRLVPVSHALATEIGAYCLIPIFCTDKKASFAIFGMSVVASLEQGLSGESFVVRYTRLTTCMMAFSIGSLVYHHRQSLAFLELPKVSIFFWALNCAVWFLKPGYPWNLGLYVSVVLSAWVTLSLSNQPQNKLSAYLGDLSYPIYLFHTACAIMVAVAWGTWLDIKSLHFFLVAYIVTIIISMAVVHFFDRPIMRLKKKP